MKSKCGRNWQTGLGAKLFNASIELLFASREGGDTAPVTTAENVIETRCDFRNRSAGFLTKTLDVGVDLSPGALEHSQYKGWQRNPVRLPVLGVGTGNDPHIAVDVARSQLCDFGASLGATEQRQHVATVRVR